MKEFKSLKFKLAAWYSVILLGFCLIFAGGTDVVITRYIVNSQPRPRVSFIFLDRTEILSDRELGIVRDSRLEDLKRIRTVIWVSMIPMTLLSFLGGYVIAEYLLRPLSKLGDEMLDVTGKNIGRVIEFDDRGDEISLLLSNFNIMSQRLALAFASQNEFVENVAHEIKTPLASLKANIELAQSGVSLSKKELKDIMEESNSSVKFLNNLLDDLMILSFGNGQLEKKEIDLLDILSELRDKYKGEKFDISVDAEKDIKVLGDKTLLTRAFENIIENSKKYSKGDFLIISAIKKGKNVEISFEDNGIGIPRDMQTKIFGRFVRIDKSRSKKSGGTGLGLAIVKSITERHGGEVSLATDNEKGTKIIVKL